MPEQPPFTLQPATWRDLMPLRHIETVCFEQDAWPMLDLIAVLTTPGVVRIKAVVGEEMVGFIAGDPHPRERLGWVTTVGVLPEYRRLRVATALLDQCEEELHMPRIRLCVRRSNLGAIQLYIGRGYHQISVWANYYISGEDALVLEKQMESIFATS